MPKNLPPVSKEGTVEYNGNVYDITKTPIGHLIRHMPESEIENIEKYKLE